MIKDDLKSLGFNKNEAAVYAALSVLGQVKAGELIKNTGIHRNLVYQALSSLQDKNLVSKSTVGKVAAFQALDPDQLLSLVHEQELTAKRVVEELKKTRKVAEQEIQVLEGIQAIRTYWLELADRQTQDTQLHIIGSGGEQFRELMGRQYLPYFERLSRSAGARVLMHPSQGYDQQHASRYNIQVKQLETASPPNVTIGFAGDEVMFAFYSGVPTVIRMHNKELADVYRSYFEILWHQTVRVETGWEAMKRVYDGSLHGLEPGQEYFVLGANDSLGQKSYTGFYDDYHKRRIQKGVRVKMLAYGSHVNRIRQRFIDQGDKDLRCSEIKRLPGIPFGLLEIHLVGGTVHLEIHAEEPMVITIKDQEVYKGLKQYFDDYWQNDSWTLLGNEGVEQLLEEVLQEGEDLYLLYANGKVLQGNRTAYQAFTRKRQKRGIDIHALAVPEVRSSAFGKVPFKSIRYLPEEFASPMVVWVFGDYVANVLWNVPQTIYLIHDKKTANYYRKHFEALKKIAKP